MTLDIETLKAQLTVLAKNAETLDIAIREKSTALQEMAAELERTKGARHYHDMVVRQMQNSLAEAEKAKSVTT